MQPIRSIYFDQQEILNNILFLHNKNNPLDLDCTYSKGVFYKGGKVRKPRLKTDKFPQTPDTIEADSTNLPFANSIVSSIMFDPPFIIHGKVKETKRNSCIMFKRFSGYENYEQLKNHYYFTLKECFRVLNDEGIVIMKIQNTVSSGKQHMTHYFTIKSAIEIGFYVLDEFVLLNKQKITSFGGKWKEQQHAMKHHSFFLVFKKTNKKVNYNL